MTQDAGQDAHPLGAFYLFGALGKNSQQTARTLLDTAADAATEDGDEDGADEGAGHQPAARARSGPGAGGRARRLMDGGEGSPRPLFSARRGRGLCACAAPVDDTGHTRPAGGRETPERGTYGDA